MHLPTYEQDHYELDNGEQLNHEFPDSFWIPDKNIRESLETGSIVKLVFRMEVTAGSDELSVERMWVRVTDKHQHMYEGELDNDPNGSDCISSGQTVFFQACHVIEVHGNQG